MNQRSIELYKQALEFAYNNVPKKDWDTGVFHPIVSGKLVELIVRECMNIAQEYDGAKLGGPGLIIAMRIESHFGVEE